MTPGSALLLWSVPPPPTGLDAMHHTQEDIERARQHVVDAELRIAKQHLLISQLETGGWQSSEARQLLSQMEDLLEQLHQHLRDVTTSEAAQPSDARQHPSQSTAGEKRRFG